MSDTPTPPTDDIQSQIKTLEDNWKRALADYQNLLKRVEAEKKDFLKFSSLNLISKFLPILDTLQLAADHSQDPGVQMATKQFQDILISEGLETISPNSGDSFTALLHDCIDILPGPTENTIAELVQKGYKIGDFVIRPAKVKVFKQEAKV